MVSKPSPNKRHDIIVANFDADVGPLHLKSCALVKIFNRKGEVYKGFAAWAPYIATPHGGRGILINDREFHKELMRAARDVYRALGGLKEGDPEPQDNGIRGTL